MSESRQRWRLVFGRDDEARYLSHLDAVRLWERAFRRGDIPVAMSEGFSPRPRLIFGAPLPLGMLAEHDLADVFLSERLTRPDMRNRLGEGMPRGYRLLELRDEWVGAPALATQIVAADYRMTLLGADAGKIEGAAAALLRAESLPRERRREKKVTRYDLRPLVLELKVSAEAGEPPGASRLWMRLRHSQERGSGRPEEVVAALADVLGLAVDAWDQGEPGEATEQTAETPIGGTAPDALNRAPLEMVRPVRERLWLAEEPFDAGGLAP